MAAGGTVRRLAAILAVDLVGYSRLMERDEGGTLARLKFVRDDVIGPLLLAHHGRVVKLMGDGALYEFSSASDAVACALAIQQEMARRESELPENERLRFRIGANLGDVIVDGEDIYGDGVNVAARLESLAEPGGICVSGKIREEVRRHAELAFVPMGRRQVKNIAEPIDVWRVDLGGRLPALRRAPRMSLGLGALAAGLAVVLLAAGATVWWAPWQGASRPGVTSVYGEGATLAVLPFENLSGDERLDRVADGLASEVIATFSNIRLINAVGRSTSFAYRGSGRDPREIGRELGVEFIVDGVLQGDGRRLSATAQLVDVRSGAQLWSGRYESAADDLSAAETELGRQIGAMLFDEVRDAAREIARRKPEEKLRAFELALLASEHRGEWSREGNLKAIELTERALALEQRSAVALTELARLYEQQVLMGSFGPAEEGMQRWRETAQNAVGADANYPFGRVVLASYHAYAGAWDAAAAEVERALALGGGIPEILAKAAEILPWLGQSARAAGLIEEATRLDPVSDFRDAQMQAAFFTEQYREVAAIIETFSNSTPWVQLLATLAYAQLGDAAALDRWRTRFSETWPDYDYEAVLESTFPPGATRERALWREGHLKAGLLCPAGHGASARGLAPPSTCDPAPPTGTAKKG